MAIDFERVDCGTNFAMSVPTTVICSRGDREIPFMLSSDFAETHPTVALVETAAAPHGWELNVDPENASPALASLLGAPRPPNSVENRR